MSKLSIRIRPSNRLTLRTDRGRQGEVGPAGYAVPIDGKTILANPLNSEASPVAISAEDARSLIGAISAPDMQSALPAPLRIPTGEQFSVPVNRQMPFRYPITVEPGAQLIVPANSILYQA